MYIGLASSSRSIYATTPLPPSRSRTDTIANGVSKNWASRYPRSPSGTALATCRLIAKSCLNNRIRYSFADGSTTSVTHRRRVAGRTGRLATSALALPLVAASEAQPTPNYYAASPGAHGGPRTRRSARNRQGPWWTAGASDMNAAFLKRWLDVFGLVVSLLDTRQRLQRCL
ncbi:MAG: hypothetical protein VB124_05155 [Burkholderia sp.]